MHAVLTLDDLATVMVMRRMMRHSNSGMPLDKAWPFALADGEVSYVGEPVAMVLADDRYIAEDAAALVAVDYEPLPFVADVRTAKDSAPIRRELSSNVITTYKVEFGDVDAAFAKAAHVFKQELWQHRGAAHSIEARGLLAELRQTDGGITVHASTQKAHDLQQTLTSLMDFDQSLRVVAPDIGGGFGAKLCVYSEDVAVVAAAKLLDRSIKWTEDRREYFTNAVHERDQYWALEIAVDADAKVLGVRGKLLHDTGAYTHPGPEHSLQLGLDHERALHRAGAVDRRHHRHEQQDAGVVGARRGLSAGGVRDGAAARSGRARDEARPRRGAAAQSHPGEQDAVQEAAEGALRRGDGIRQRRLSGLPGRGAGRRRLGRVSRSGRPRRERAAAISASGLRMASRAPAAGRSSPASCGFRGPARSPCSPARPRWGKGSAPRWRRSRRPSSASASTR